MHRMKNELQKYSKINIEIRIYYIIAISDTICKGAVICLVKFIARKPEKEVISMRISTDTLQVLDDKAISIGISRNELINQMILFALANMEESPEDKKK